jgi:hypothetical protein
MKTALWYFASPNVRREGVNERLRALDPCRAAVPAQGALPNHSHTACGSGWEVKEQQQDRDPKEEKRKQKEKQSRPGEQEKQTRQERAEMVLVTARDEAMLEWLSVVRVSDMASIRFALAAFAEANQPVSLRRAQQWVARLRSTELIETSRLTMQDGSVVWASQRATWKRPLNLLAQTFRHDVAVASASARYLFNGWTWSRDRQAEGFNDHQADGVATRAGETELVEVELTPKAIERYVGICTSHSWRMGHEGVTRVVYLCTADATRMVAREADKLFFRDDRSRLVTITAFDKRGTWIDESGLFPEVWSSTSARDVSPNELLPSRVIRARSENGERPVTVDRLF